MIEQKASSLRIGLRLSLLLLLACAGVAVAQAPELPVGEITEPHVHDDMLWELQADHDSVNLQAHTYHVWSCQNIFAIVDTGSDSQHRLDCQLRCSIGGETKYGSQWASHNYQFIWYSYNQYSSTQHQYKRDDRCTACAHVKHSSTFQPHQCQSAYDTYCDLCGYSNVRMCG
ncbi:MAG: hypothetical protein SF066_09745 [Thermoanaerobaculia bacterium]|nr:hypothetical protein [Thermoanaerobaculia bacterium]